MLQGWRTRANEGIRARRPDPDEFRAQSRDMYVPAGDVSFWQAAVRARDDPDWPTVEAANASGGSLDIDLLYGDHEGGQRTISRFALTRVDDGNNRWHCSVVRHWSIDYPNPRDS